MKLIPGHLYFDKGDHKTRVYVGQYAITPRKTADARKVVIGNSMIITTMVDISPAKVRVRV